MGLKQEVEPSFGEQSIRLSTRPLSERLSWFDHRFRTPVQQTIQGFIASALILSGVHSTLLSVSAEPLPQSTGITRLVTPESSTITPLTLELSDRVTHEIVKPLINLGLDIDLTGELLTNAWIDDEGKGNIVYRNIWLQTGLQAGMEDKLKLVDTPDWLNQLGLDEQLAAGILGDPLPPRQDTDIEAGEETEAFLSALNSVLDIGPVKGYRNYGPFEVYRTPNVAIMRILEGPQANTFQLTNTGYQAVVAGLFPKEYTLSPLPFATGGGTIPTPQETAQIEINPAGLKLEYKSSGGRYIVKNSPDADYGFRPPSQEGADALDQAIAPLGKTLSVVPKKDLTTPAYGDFAIFNKDPMSGGITKKVIIMHPAVNPDDPNNIQLQYNKVAPDDIKIDPEYLKEQNSLLQGTLGSTVARAIFGVANLWDIRDPKTQEESKILEANITNTSPPSLELVVT